MHHPRGELAHRREAPVARRRFLERQELAGALLHHPLESLGFRLHLLLEAGALGDVALDRDRAAHPLVRIVEGVRVDLDHRDVPLGAAAHLQRLAAHALAAQGAGRGMLVDEQGGAAERAGAVELPELAQRLRVALPVLLLRLRVGPYRLAVGVHHAHRVGQHVEDRLELRDAAGEVLTQAFALGDVGAGEEDPATASHRDDGRAAGGDVDLLGEVGQRVREGVVDRPAARLRDIESCEVAIARVRRDQGKRPVEQGDSQRHGLEQRVEAVPFG